MPSSPGWRRSVRSWFYHPGAAIVGFFSRFFWHATIEGVEHLPRSGPFILVTNHCSNLDPLMMGWASGNQIDRVVAIRDVRISTESFRRVAFHGREAYVYHDEYAVIDRTGRLQIPKEYLERLDVTERAKLRLTEGAVEVLPEDTELEEDGVDDR